MDTLPKDLIAHRTARPQDLPVMAVMGHLLTEVDGLVSTHIQNHTMQNAIRLLIWVSRLLFDSAVKFNPEIKKAEKEATNN